MDSVKFNIGDIVYRVIDGEAKGMVVSIIFRPSGIMYEVSWSGENEAVWVHDIELTTERTFEVKSQS